MSSSAVYDLQGIWTKSASEELSIGIRLREKEIIQDIMIEPFSEELISIFKGKKLRELLNPFSDDRFMRLPLGFSLFLKNLVMEYYELRGGVSFTKGQPWKNSLCRCMGVFQGDIKKLFEKNPLIMQEEVIGKTGITTGCGGCESAWKSYWKDLQEGHKLSSSDLIRKIEKLKTKYFENKGRLPKWYGLTLAEAFLKTEKGFSSIPRITVLSLWDKIIYLEGSKKFEDQCQKIMSENFPAWKVQLVFI